MNSSNPLQTKQCPLLTFCSLALFAQADRNTELSYLGDRTRSLLIAQPGDSCIKLYPQEDQIPHLSDSLRVFFSPLNSTFFLPIIINVILLSLSVPKLVLNTEVICVPREGLEQVL